MGAGNIANGDTGGSHTYVYFLDQFVLAHYIEQQYSRIRWNGDVQHRLVAERMQRRVVERVGERLVLDEPFRNLRQQCQHAHSDFFRQYRDIDQIRHGDGGRPKLSRNRSGAHSDSFR